VVLLLTLFLYFPFSFFFFLQTTTHHDDKDHGFSSKTPLTKKLQGAGYNIYGTQTNSLKSGFMSLSNFTNFANKPGKFNFNHDYFSSSPSNRGPSIYHGGEEGYSGDLKYVGYTHIYLVVSFL
jgi:hypothetical protein